MKSKGAHAGGHHGGGSSAAAEMESEEHHGHNLGLLSSIALVMGSMFGSGIFIVSADMARLVDSPALLIACWLCTGIITVMGALSYGELAAMLPKAGGQYVYLKEAYGPLLGFIYGWTAFLVVQTGTIAAISMAFGKFLGCFFPAISTEHWLWHIKHVPPVQIGSVVLGNIDIGLNTLNLTAMFLIIVLTLIHMRGVKLGALVHNILTSIKILAGLSLLVVAFFLTPHATAFASNFGANFWRGASLTATHYINGGLQADHTALMISISTVMLVLVGQVGSLFASDGWNNLTFLAGEVRNPSRNLKWALILGPGCISLLYIAMNFAYLWALPLAGSPTGATLVSRGLQYATEDRIAVAVFEQVLGEAGIIFMGLAMAISALGSCNGTLMSAPRIYYAMAKDKLFFNFVATVHKRYKTPVAAFALQGLWACIICLSGTFAQILDYVIFAVVLSYGLTVSSLFVLRYKYPKLPRPYKVPLYPFLPLLYLVLIGATEVALLKYKPQYTWPGLFIVLLGIPVYFLYFRAKHKAHHRRQQAH